MLQEITELQNSAVEKLLDLTRKNAKKTYTFRAPTGSGKTYMMADYMNRLLQVNPNVVFLVSSLSKSDLAKQNYDKFCEYRDNHGFLNLNPYLINSDIAGEERLYIDQYDRLIKNVASFYFLIFNYWYIKKVHNIIDYNDEAIKSLSDDIKTLVDGEVYSLNFDKLLDNFINVKHIHGSFADKLEKYQDLVSCMTSSTSFLYKFVFGTSGVEKLSSMNQLYNNNVSGFDYDFLYGDKDFGHLLVYGVSFGLSNIVPQELKGRYKDFYLSNCVEGHILVRLDALYQAKKVKTITIAYYSEEDRSNYQELFKFCDCKEIISYVKCSDLF